MNRKLTEEQVEEIRFRRHKNGTTQTQLAKEYGVSKMTINDLLHYRTWAPF